MRRQMYLDLMTFFPKRLLKPFKLLLRNRSEQYEYGKRNIIETIGGA